MAMCNLMFRQAECLFENSYAKPDSARTLGCPLMLADPREFLRLEIRSGVKGI